MRRVPSSLAICLMLMALPLAAAGPDRTITVRGRAEVVFPPDHIVVHAGVVERADNAKTAQRKSRDRVAAVLSFLKTSGIAPEDLVTERTDLREGSDPVEEGRAAKEVKRYFEASVGIRFKLRDLQKYDEVIAGITELGANRLYAVVSESTVRAAKAKEARIQAVLAAKQKATYLAEQLGLAVGPPVTVTEVVEKSYFDRSVLNSNSSIAYSDDLRGQTGSSFSPSELSVVAEFDIVFELVRS